jgi:DNA-binding PadR family transcriptional regulator
MPSAKAAPPSPEFVVLGFLYFEPQHGYDLHKHIRAELGELWRISQSQTYNILNRLEKAGRIQAEQQPQPHRPERTCFSLTPAGREQFERWLHAPTPAGVRSIRIEFLTRLFFARRMGAELCARLLAEQTAAVTQVLARLQAHAADVPPGQVINRLGLDLRIRQTQTLLDWMKTCGSKLFP